jgi:hypothetical protein
MAEIATPLRDKTPDCVAAGPSDSSATIARAFSSEVDTGSREDNAIKQRGRAFPRFGETRKCSTQFDREGGRELRVHASDGSLA